MIKKYFISGLVSGVILYSVVVIGSEVNGRELYYKECVKCHRKEGRHAGIISDVAGKQEGYLVEQLRNFKSGRRHAAIFAPIKKRLSEKQIRAVAKFIAQILH